MKKKLFRRGFTLIELIITVAIIAVLVATLAVALNPSEQLARSRDSKRVADLDAAKTALNLYGATATGTIALDASSTPDDSCIGGTAANQTKYVNTGVAGTGTINLSSGYAKLNATTTQTVGTGWMPAQLQNTPGGSPIAVLPLDPSNGTGAGTSFYYAYACRKSNNTYELTARLESSYFGPTTLNLPGTDGGNNTGTYEVGTDLTILAGTSTNNE